MKKQYKYERIADELRERIKSGVWRESGAFPTELQLSESYSVCHLTIRRALAVLIDEGLIMRQRGRGSFVTDAVTNNESTTRILYVGKMDADFYKEMYLAMGRACSLEEMVCGADAVVCSHEMVATMLPIATRNAVRIIVVDLYHHNYEEFSGHVVAADLFRATRLATDHLLACGHRDIGFIGTPDRPVAGQPYSRPALDRLSLQGYRASCQMVELDVQRSREVGVPGISVEECEQNLVVWMKGLRTWPTAFVCDGDYRAAALIRAAARFKKSCPVDFSVIGTCNTPWCETITPALTSVYMGEHEMAELAILLATHGGQIQPSSFQVSPRLVIRQSVNAREA